MSKFAEELDELIEQFIEDGEAKMDEIIGALELKLAALKEERGK